MMTLPDLPVPEQLKFTMDKLPTLLLALGEEPVEIRACKRACIHPVALAFARKADPQLNEMIEWAMQVGFSVVEERIYARSMGENRVPKMFEGKPLTYIDLDTGDTRYIYEESQSDSLLKKFAERIRPDLYGDQIQVKVDNRTTLYLPEEVMADQFEKLLAAQADKTRLIQSEGLQGMIDRIDAAGRTPPIDAEFHEVHEEEDDLAGLT